MKGPSTTIHGDTQQYWFPTPTIDTRINPAVLSSNPVAALASAVGVDGRYQGELRRFPGFYTESDWGLPTSAVLHHYWTGSGEVYADKSVTIEIGGSLGTKFFQYFALQRDTGEQHVIRGWLLLCHYVETREIKSFIDLACDEDGTTVTSAAKLFQPWMAGKTLTVTAGTNWDTGNYVISSVTDVGTIVLAETPCDGGAGSGGTANLSATAGVDRDVLVAHYYDPSDEAWHTDVVAELSPRAIPRSGVADGESVSEIRTGPCDVFNGPDTDILDGWEGIVRDTTDGHYECRLVAATTGDAQGDVTFAVPNQFSFSVASEDRYQLRPRPYLHYVTEMAVAVRGSVMYVTGLRESLDGETNSSFHFAIRRLWEESIWRDSYTINSVSPNYIAWVINPGSDFLVPKRLNFYTGATIYSAAMSEVGVIVGHTEDAGWNYTRIGTEYIPAAASAQGLVTVTCPFWCTTPIRPGAITANTAQVLGHLFFDADLPNLGDTAGTMMFQVGTSDDGGQLDCTKDYTIAYRLVAPEQQWRSSLSNLYTVESWNTTATGKLTATIEWPTQWVKQHTRKVIELYRSTGNATVPGTDVEAAQLFLDSEVELDDDEHEKEVIWGELVPDTGLVLLEALDPTEVVVLEGSPAASDLVAYEDVMLWLTGAGEEDEDQTTDDIRWSNLDADRPNYLPLDNKRPQADLSARLLKLVPTGGFVAVVGNNEVIRIHRSGSKLSVETIHNRHGVVAGAGALGVGTTLFLVSQAGLLMCDLSSGDLATVGAVQGFFNGDWKGTLSDVQLGYDTTLGALIVVNTNTSVKEAFIIWLNEGTVTSLKYVPFTDVTQGPDPETVGEARGWWLGPSAIYRVNNDREAPTETMSGGPVAANYNITQKTGGASASYVRAALVGAESDYAGLVGFPIVATSGENAYSVRYITSAALSGSDLLVSVDTNWDNVPAVGDTFSLAPIVFSAVLPPVSHGTEQPVLDLFREKKVTAMVSSLARWTVDDGDPNDFLVYRLYNGTGETILAETTVAMSVVPDETTATIQYNGVSLLPAVANYASDCPMSLVAVGVTRTIEKSKRV